jgi:hypothetical protein
MATIEAIYYFFVDFFEAAYEKTYDGRWDDLLLLYLQQLQRVEKVVSERSANKPLAWRNN